MMPSRRKGGQNPSGQRRRQRQEDECRQPPALKGSLQEQEDRDHAVNEPHSIRRWAPCLSAYSPSSCGMVSKGKLDFLEPRCDVGRNRAEIASPHVGGNVDAPRKTLALDDVRRGHDANIGNIARRTLPPSGVSMRSSRTLVHAVALFRN